MRELYIFLWAKPGEKKKSPGRMLLPYQTHERGSKRKYEGAGKARGGPIMPLPVSRYSDWLGLLKDEFIGPLQLIHRGDLLRGNIIHFLLSCVGNISVGGMEEALKLAGVRAKAVFPYEKKLEEYIAIARKMIGDERFRRFFYVEGGSVYQEKEVADSHGRRKVIDRLIVMDREAWVVDYKSSKDPSGSQAAQVAEYMGIVKALYPKFDIKGFLIYLDTLTIEEVPWNG